MTGNVRSDYDIRVARLEDGAAVDALLQASYPTLMASSYDVKLLSAALELMKTANPALLGSGTYYLAELPTRFLIGCGGWTLERPGAGTVEPQVGHIRHFAVHPEWTGRGVGRAIYGVCERAARAAGVTAFECYSSLNAEKFYRALDFKRIREIDIELRPHVVLRAVWMRHDFAK